MSQPCPRCGGTDRFYLVTRPRNGGSPFWLCSHCRHVERAADGETGGREPIKRLSVEERQQVYRGYQAVAEWCAVYLWTPDGKPGLEFLRARGFSDETIHQAGLGYHPVTWGYPKTGDLAVDYGVGGILPARDRGAYEGAQLGGLLGPQGRPKWPLRGSITIPYRAPDGTVTMLRMRKLEAQKGKKYFSPSGVGLYAGGAPTLYGVDTLANVPAETPVILTEGEFKALLCQQHGLPAVAQPGVAYLPDSYLDQLAGRRVIIGYDVEARSDPFQLSPGERATIAAVEKLTGLDVERELSSLATMVGEAKAKAKTSDPDLQTEALLEVEALVPQLKRLGALKVAMQARRIATRVLRLPRAANEAKVDLDGFILARGADALRDLVTKATDARDWHARHHGGGFRYEKGGIWNGRPIANYQARIVETVFQSDGQQLTAIQRLALRTPSGRLLQHDITDEDWADDRAARHKLRLGLREGTFYDDPREVLSAIRLLSNQGDPPVERTEITATGWAHLHDHWHFLAGDGAVTADGISTTHRAEIDPDASGNHYALCGAGDAAIGAQAWLKFLRGEVCPQPLALILAAQAALPLIHRFAGDAGRTMVWLFHQTGALKTALTRASVMALYGSTFTAERADGAPIPKWDSTSPALEILAFTYRDMPLLIDDYKPGVINPDAFKKFLHNYSESTGRNRATRRLQIERGRLARAIIFATAEDLPSIGDAGMDARLLAMQLHPAATKPDALAELQRAGASGHLAAFWRGFIQRLAGELDRLGETGVRAHLQQVLRTDDAQLPGHRRAQGALRQNRLAWLVLSAWLVQAGHVTAEEATHLNAAHLEARALLAQLATERQRDNKPSTIFLTVLRELLQSGELLIEQPDMRCSRCTDTMGNPSPMVFTNQGWFCTGRHGAAEIPCTFSIPAEKIVGFEAEDGTIGIFAEMAFRHVARIRKDQNQMFAFSSKAIWQMLDVDGLLAAKGRDGYPIKKRNPARRKDGYPAPMNALVLKAHALRDEEDGSPGDETHDHGSENVGSTDQAGTKSALAHQNAIGEGGAHRIKSDQNRLASDQSEPGSAEEGVLIRLDPVCSDASDQEIMAPQRHETDLDPIDPTFSTHRSMHGSPPLPKALAHALNESLWRGAIKAYLSDDTLIVNRIATGRGLTYEVLVEHIMAALQGAAAD